MLRSKPTRTLKRGPRVRKQPPVMVDPEVENVPESESCPGGGLIIRYKDTEGHLYDEIFSPNDPIALSKKWLPVAMKDLDYPVVSTPPKLRDQHLYRTFRFSSSLWIRVWDPNIPIPAGGILELFGADIVDIYGRPQAVNTRVKVIVGVRLSLSLERPGDIVAAYNDIGVRIDRFDLLPSRYPLAADSEYIFKDGRHEVTYTFHHNLLNEPAPERLPRWTRPNLVLSRSRSVDSGVPL
ncbi:uncharacterized protein EV420DRAFT_1643030 [Desarmillaria tabescens]|uniref:Uncharacterized protein n=1 Tax=Armillaria tabescens TaxID=1929756 RepID=A0AA39N511_ARMTA|nr:uncharacterized protein EV420DRAFT_1643030 [Desarmillaria tabescens]KAK0458147.1 hypothetical protein EV420DRAFT_1643030 [Desarmillaria tabescens]